MARSARKKAAFGACTVQRPDGSETRLDACWRDGPAVVVFIRHFG